MFFAVYHYFERIFKSDMSDESIFINYIKLIQKINIIITFIDIGINSEISNPE